MAAFDCPDCGLLAEPGNFNTIHRNCKKLQAMYKKRQLRPYVTQDDENIQRQVHELIEDVGEK